MRSPDTVCFELGALFLVWSLLLARMVRRVRKLPALPGWGNTMTEQHDQEAEAWHGDP